MKMNLKDKVVLITGGADGIGKDLVIESAKKGAKVVFCDITNEKAELLKTELSAQGYDNVFYYHCDVSSPEQVKNMFEQIKETFGELHVLVNNAAKQTVATWDEMTDEEFSSVIDVNLKGVYYCMKYASKIMNRGSNITNILSVYHNKARLHKYHYDAAKGGVAQLTREGALALGERDISVNGIYPGYVITPMNAHEDRSKATLKNVLKDPQIIESKNFALSILSYIEDFSRMTTGQIFGVDAGRGL